MKTKILVGDDLVLANFSLRFADFNDRVVAAASAGFSGIGLYVGEFERYLASGLSTSAMAAFAADHGIRITELEVLTGWAGPSADRPASRDREEQVFAMADVFGSRHVQAIGPFAGSLEKAADAFASMCDRAAEHGLLVGLEYLPFTNITDARTALAIAELADRPNGGLCLDTWHHFRGTADWDGLAAVPADRVVVVQLNDGPLVPESKDYYIDTLHNRMAPGEGEFDLLRFFSLLADGGVSAPLSVEVISARLQERPAIEVAAHLAGTTRQLLDDLRAVA